MEIVIVPSSRAAYLRGLPRVMHRWTAVGLLVLLIPISLSGALLVWHDALDATLYPERFATTRGATLLPAATYLANAAAAQPDAAQPVALRFPAGPDRPVAVTVRTGTPARLVTVYLDPPNG